MSRSFKKEPVVKDDNDKRMKRLANKRVRQSNTGLSKGNKHKHLSQSYDIADYNKRWTFKDAVYQYQNDESFRSQFESYDDFVNYYNRCTKYK